MSRGARVRPIRLGLATLALASCCAWSPVAQAEVSAPVPGAATTVVAGNGCGQLAASAWPTTAIARRAQLQRFETARPQCMHHAGFLAALGGMWLEEGEPNQALIWLERSLLLDPGSLGAQADHALSLAALGEPAALDALTKAWQARSDIPAALRQKLLPKQALTASSPLPPVRLGRAANSNGQWVGYREATLLMGYESNLDHSPRLTEITLTAPGGPFPLPLLDPLTPRKGAAVLADLAWQVARSPQAGQIWRLGVNLGARSAPGSGSTDWYHLQLAASGSQQSGPWRGQLEVSATRIGGPLNEPYQLLRLSATGERNALGCVLRLALEAEDRAQSITSSADGRTVGALWSTQCPLPAARDWSWGAAVRGSVDRPKDETRTGGAQRLWSLGLRVLGPVGRGTRLDGSLRISRVRDDEGYSPLLENNARRNLTQSQLSVELTRPLNLADLPGAEALLQWQGVRQDSNLSVFRHSGVSTYAGLRWAW